MSSHEHAQEGPQHCEPDDMMYEPLYVMLGLIQVFLIAVIGFGMGATNLYGHDRIREIRDSLVDGRLGEVRTRDAADLVATGAVAEAPGHYRIGIDAAKQALESNPSLIFQAFAAPPPAPVDPAATPAVEGAPAQ